MDIVEHVKSKRTSSTVFAKKEDGTLPFWIKCRNLSACPSKGVSLSLQMDGPWTHEMRRSYSDLQILLKYIDKSRLTFVRTLRTVGWRLNLTTGGAYFCNWPLLGITAPSTFHWTISTILSPVMWQSDLWYLHDTLVSRVFSDAIHTLYGQLWACFGEPLCC